MYLVISILFFVPSDLLSDISISKCGHNDITEKSFLDNQIPFTMFCSNPEILSHPDVVVKMNGK